MFETGANRWRSFESWPPKAATPRTLFLQPGGKLAFTAPAAGAPPYDEYVSDPRHPVPCLAEASVGCPRRFAASDQRFAAARPDVLVYATEPLARDVTAAGPIEVDLYVSSTGTDADFVVKLIDENPPRLPGPKHQDPDRGGQQTLLRAEPFRARFRESYSDPKALVPGQLTRIRFSLNDVMHTFQRKHRITIHVQSSLFPFIDRNPQRYLPSIYTATASDFTVATQRVHHTAAQPSGVTLRILPALDD